MTRNETQPSDGSVIDIERIMQLIPHRYPFLMIDRVVDVVKNESAVGVKNVSINEPQFQGHFGRHPVMPGVYIIESMAQSAAVLVVESLGKEFEGKLVYFMGSTRRVSANRSHQVTSWRSMFGKISVVAWCGSSAPRSGSMARPWPTPHSRR